RASNAAWNSASDISASRSTASAVVERPVGPVWPLQGVAGGCKGFAPLTTTRFSPPEKSLVRTIEKPLQPPATPCTESSVAGGVGWANPLQPPATPCTSGRGSSRGSGVTSSGGSVGGTGWTALRRQRVFIS